VYVTLRYHVASLIGVLCSLVLGILIGAALFQDDRLVKEQGVIIAELEEQFARLKVALAEATERERAIAQGWESVKGQLVAGLLEGRTVVLASRLGAVDWRPIAGTLEAAGAACVELPWDGLGEAASAEDSAIVLWWGEGQAEPDIEGRLRALAAAGARTVLLQGIGEQGTFPDVEALCIDMADTFLGELALVYGLAAEAAGHYGIKTGAQGVLPKVAPGP